MTIFPLELPNPGPLQSGNSKMFHMETETKMISKPKRSMYGIFTYIYHKNYPNAGK